MEKAIEAKSQLAEKTVEQHESSAILANMIMLKERELTKVADTAGERDALVSRGGEAGR